MVFSLNIISKVSENFSEILWYKYNYNIFVIEKNLLSECEIWKLHKIYFLLSSKHVLQLELNTK